MIRVAFVTGSRSFKSDDKVWEWLDWQAKAAIAQHADSLVVMHGACPTGGDNWAHTWVVSRSPVWTQPRLKVYEQADPALWGSILGKQSGPARNKRQAARLLEYRQHGGVDIHIAVAHHLPDLVSVASMLRGGTMNQVHQLLDHGFRLDEMTYLEES